MLHGISYILFPVLTMVDKRGYWMFSSDEEKETLIDFKQRKRGPVPMTTTHPGLVTTVRNFIESNSAQAHDRRRTESAYTNGVSLEDIRKNVLQNEPGIDNISRMTIHRMMKPANRSSRNASRHSGLVDARIPPKRNESAKSHPDLHFTHASVNYVNELVALFDDECAAFSCDDKNKLNVGTLAVSRHFKMNRFFSCHDTPNYPDHDFPFANSKLIPSGYMRLEKKRRSRSLTRLPSRRVESRRTRSSSPVVRSDVTTDRKGRTRVSWPRTGPLNVFLQAARFHGSNSSSHVRQLKKVINPIVNDPVQPRTVVSLITDGGPDWSPKSTINIYNYGRMWKELKLDGLILVLYAPRHSRFNPIERAWAPLSKWLAGVTFPRTLDGETLPPSQQRGLSEDEKQAKEMEVFDRASRKCAKYWHGKKYDGHKVTVHVVASQSSGDHEHERVKRLIDAPKMPQTATVRRFRNDLKFLMSHCVRRPYQLEFYKCKTASCDHCVENPIKATKFFSMLEEFGGMVPTPVTDTSRTKGEYFPVLRLLSTPDYVQRSMDLDLPSGPLTSCKQGCKYVFLTEADKKRHRKLIH